MSNCVVMEVIRFVGFVILFVGYINALPGWGFSPPVIKNVTGKEIIVNVKHTLTLICEGKEKLTWTYPNHTLEETYWSTVNVETSESNGKYSAKLILMNASYVDVDYYYCHAEKAAKDDKERSTKIYVYVRDEQHLSAVPVEDIVFLTVQQRSTIILPCRPTSPDVTVSLMDINDEEVASNTWMFDKHIGYSVRIGNFGDNYVCKFERDGEKEELTIITTIITETDHVPKPYIEASNNGKTKIGDTYVLNCTVTVDQNVYFTLTWTTPNRAAVESNRTIMTTASAIDVQGGRQGSSTLTIHDVRMEDQGLYSCTITDHTAKNNTVIMNITVFGENGSYINLHEENGMYTINSNAGAPDVTWVIIIDSFPKASIEWINNRGEEIIWQKTKLSKYYFDKQNNKATLKINQITLNDSGVYQIIANNGKTEKKLNLTLIVKDKPTVHIVSDDYHIFGENASLDCVAAGNPIPTIEWFFKPCQNESCTFWKLPKTMYTSKIIGLQTTSTLKMNATVTGLIKCFGSNNLDNDSYTQGFYITDVEEGFNMLSSEVPDKVAAGSKIKLTCAVSKYNYTQDVTWYIENGKNNGKIPQNKKFKIEKSTTDYTYRATLIINPITKNDSGRYICEAKFSDTGLGNRKSLELFVKDPMVPKIYSTNMNGTTIRIKPGHKLQWHCTVSGIPVPKLIWTKDNQEWSKGVNHNHVKVYDNKFVFDFVQEEDAGTYACKAVNSKGSDEKTMRLEIIGANRGSWSVTFVIITVTLALFFLVLVTVLVVKIKKEKKLRRELRIAGLMNFEKGALENLNPELGIDEQADLLPYDKKWEFPRDKLKLGKQLGSGAFGVVMKAEAFGLEEGETISIVAVKMVKRNADYTYIKALASELKIMVHLGKHLNVVNLLGACTKNVTKRELLVIVEYCRFGNLHNYLLRHRDDFVNQIDMKTGQIDTSIGTEFLNRTMSVGSNQSGSRTMASAGVDYRATPNPSSTTDSSVVCSPTGEDIMILSNNSSVQPEWRSNYRGDYKGNVRPTSTHDLLCWAFQVARGMEYLASRKVLHGDLAARNILLAEDNIVKICDFGLAKSMYKSDNYKKKGDGPLPVKWMAIESIRDRVFSTQSDVWSFGIVLWEFFSLARTPYPGMDADERLYNKLVDGYRMDQPEYSTTDIYQIMMECWHAKPVYRPSFTKLAEDLGDKLQDTVKKHYIDLNDPYIMMNHEQLEGHSDYLAMMSPPDYGNLASPGHEYVNGKKYPEEEQPAGEASGYLPMDVFSPRSNDGCVFDFDVPKNKNVNGESATGVELVPMLHANESDNDLSPTSPSKSFANPNYQTNPTVDNNKTSAPKKDSIVSTSDNYINMPQQKSTIKNNSDSFSNPSYIHMNEKSLIGEENDKSNYVNSHSRDWERPMA